MAASNQGALSSGYKLEAFWLLYGKIWSFFHYNMHTHQIKYFFRMPNHYAESRLKVSLLSHGLRQFLATVVNNCYGINKNLISDPKVS